VPSATRQTSREVKSSMLPKLSDQAIAELVKQFKK